MNWVSKRLFGAVANPGDPPAMQGSLKASLSGDAAQLRGAMIGATSETERFEAAGALGRVLAEQLEDPQLQDSPEVLVSAICHVANNALAQSWMERLEEETWLAEVALRANLSEVRLGAARRVKDTTILEQIAEGSRNRDKSVYRHCSELLRQRRQSSKRAHRAEELKAGLRVLLDQVPISLSQLLDFERQLGALKEGETSPAEEEALALLEQARTRLQAESMIQRELNTGLAAARLLCNECSSGRTWPESHQLEDWRTRHEALSSLRTQLPAWLDRHASAQELGNLVADTASRLNSLDSDSEHLVACDRFLAALAADNRATVTVKEAWAALPKPEHPAARMALEARWHDLFASLSGTVEPVPSSAEQKRTNPAIVAKLLDELENRVVEGNLAGADAIQKELSAVLAGSSLRGAAESRLQRIHAQMNELRGWARWSNGQAREQLISKAEELPKHPVGISDLVKKISALREEWKRIDSFGPATKSQWERFDSILTKAYQPVAAHRADITAQRAQTRIAQEALCTEWEAEFAAIVWEHVNYPQVEARREDMLKQWRALAKPGRRLDQAPGRRFDALIGDIDRRLTAVRTAEVERCENIIIEAQGLQEMLDGGRATAQIKALQEQWTKQRGALRLNRRDEQKLWLRFRAACDAVFAKRDELRKRQVARRKEQTQAHQDLLDGFAASLTGADVRAVKHALNRFVSDVASQEIARGGIDRFKKRANELVVEAKQRIETLLRESCRARNELLANKAALAQQVEAATLMPGATQLIAEARQAWEDLPKLQGKAEARLADRFAKATSASPEKLAAGRDMRDTLLLDMEMALGLPSPQSSAEKRRKRQLENLQKRFGGNALPTADVAALVIEWYATAAFPDAGLNERMAAVLAKTEDQAVMSGR